MMTPLVKHYRKCFLLAAAVGLSAAAIADEQAVFRVCSDPNNLPFSARTEDGLENKIAQLWADELGQRLEYTWFPQRRGFLRQTLKSIDRSTASRYKCDVVMGVAAAADSLLTTRAYYRSTYALVYVKGQKLDSVASGADFLNLNPAVRDSLRIGAFVPTPGMKWLARHGMTHQSVAFQAMSADPAAYPGEVVEKELVSGRLDAAVVWGPIGGFFAKQERNLELVVVPLESEPGIRFDFPIAAGVRYGDGERKQVLEKLIVDTAEPVAAILAEYNVPLLALQGTVERDDD